MDEFITLVHPPPGSEEDTSVAFNNSSKLSETPRDISQTQQFQMSVEIDNTNKHFKGQQKNEIMHCFCRKHWIVLLPHFIGFVIAMGLLAALFYLGTILDFSSYRIIAALVILGLTYYLHYFFIRLFNYYIQTLIITNFRVIQIDQTLFFHRNRDSIDVPEIQDIVIQQNGLFKTIFNYGEIIITLSSAHSTKTLYCVPNPEYHFRKINKTKREYITFRRMEKGKI